MTLTEGHPGVYAALFSNARTSNTRCGSNALCNDGKGFSRGFNYRLLSLISVYVYFETDFVSVFCLVTFVLEKPWVACVKHTRVAGVCVHLVINGCVHVWCVRALVVYVLCCAQGCASYVCST